MAKITVKKYFFVLIIYLLVFTFFSHPLLNAQCGETWTLVNYQRGYAFRAIAHNGSRFVAIGDYGVNWTSDDGKDWIHRPDNRTNTFDITYAASKFVLVGAKGFIATSPDGKYWTERTTPTSEGLWGIIYGDGTFVATGNGGTILSSSDGITWTMRTSGVAANLMDVVYGDDGLFVAVGTGGYILTSSNGINWTHQTNVSQNLVSVTYGAGLYVAGGRDEFIYTSPDASNWTKRYQGTANYYVQDLVYTGSMFVAVGTYGHALTSPNGLSWAKRDAKAPTTIMGVTYMDGTPYGTVVVAVGLAGQINMSLCTPGAADPELILASPNGEEEWIGGEKKDILWGSFGDVGNVKLEYSTNNGETWNVITASTANNGTYSWTVPNSPSSQCQVRISEASGSVPPDPDTSNANFTIKSGSSGATITIISPNGGETLLGATTHTITWTGSKQYDSIDLEYYDGSEWHVIVSGTEDDGQYNWTVPNISTNNARLWIKGWSLTGNAIDYTDSTYEITENSSAAIITLTSPNGGETLVGNTTHTIRWTSSIQFDSVDIEYYDGSSWHVIENGTEDDGEYDWIVPNIATNTARMWIKGWSDEGNPIDFTDNSYSIEKGVPMGTILVTSPNGGEGWLQGSTHPITWDSFGNVGNVTISYSANGGDTWTTIIESTENDGEYTWSLPADLTSAQCRVEISDDLYPQISDRSDYMFSVGSPPEISLSKTRFNFGYLLGSAVYDVPQKLFISSTSAVSLNWTATADASWINLDPASGSGDGVINISINPLSMGVGDYIGTITISDPDALNSPQTVNVYLKIKYSWQDKQPFGLFATPDDGSTGISGSVPVTGWALDDIGIVSVKIYREVNHELSYIGDADLVEGARPDVELAYPDYPYNYSAGWGYMMLTNFLPEGKLVLKAIASDTTGNNVVLGTKTIYLDHPNAEKPFGAIDAPDQGGDASGSNYRNLGWVLTPPPNKIPEDGSTINVFIDGVFIGKANYNIFRADIAQLFPGYANSNGAMAYLDFDTTTYDNGVHTIQWSVTDNAGNTDGIGSRYFTIQNTTSEERKSVGKSETQETGFLKNKYRPSSLIPMPTSTRDIPDIPVDRTHIRFKKGYNENTRPGEISLSEGNVSIVEIRESERIEIWLGDYAGKGKRVYTGYMMVNGKQYPLPIGSTFDQRKGVFYWQPGAGFFGEYRLVFISREPGGRTVSNNILIRILPKFSK
jgi:hypothetical protein